MQKINILFIATVSVFIFFGCQSFQGIKKENICVYKSTTPSSVTMPCDEQNDLYDYHEDDNLQEYEKHVCDEVISPKISAKMALCTELGGFLLIKFITLREAMLRYFVKFKTVVNKLMKFIVRYN